jgi:hemin uptake protein HemP
MTDTNNPDCSQDRAVTGNSPPAGDGTLRTKNAGPSVINSVALFAGANEVQIEHQGILYRLRRTSLGKLILTK